MGLLYWLLRKREQEKKFEKIPILTGKRILLKKHELEYEESLTKFRIMLTPVISISYGSAIAFVTK